MSDVKTDGIIALYVDVKVDIDEMRDWKPSTIGRFFSGIAMVEAAREQGSREAPNARPIMRCAHGKTDREPCEACGTTFVWPATR